jgi:dsRNA-specific ribonuclease
MQNVDRSDDFIFLISSLLKRSSLKNEFINLCLKKIDRYNQSFTSSSSNSILNYEYYEQIGDGTINKFIVTYMYKRFPQLRTSDGVEVVARLKIKYGSKGQLYQIAEKLGFWPFIVATEDVRTKRKKALLEDVFEAFFGCTEEVVNETIHEINGTYYPGIGFDICWSILASIFDELKINIDYDFLVDSKTKLKELFDEFKNSNLRYSEVHCPETKYFLSSVYDGDKFLGSGKSLLKRDAQEKAAEQALKNLSRMGIVKKIPNHYLQFSRKHPTE